jgi:hypothetical protein
MTEAAVVQHNNNDLRVKFLLGELSETDMRTNLQKRDKAYRKNLAKRQIYHMVYQTATDIYRILVNKIDAAETTGGGGGGGGGGGSDTASKQNSYHSSYVELGALLKYANTCLERLEKTYTCRTLGYNLNPFVSIWD